MPHTSGPWVIRDHTVGHPPRRAWIEINAPLDGGRGEHPVCRIPSGFTNQDEDARLISASPDLLAVCEEMLGAMYLYEMDVEESPPRDHVQMMERARNAIAKARPRGAIP